MACKCQLTHYHCHHNQRYHHHLHDDLVFYTAQVYAVLHGLELCSFIYVRFFVADCKFINFLFVFLYSVFLFFLGLILIYVQCNFSTSFYYGF